LSASKRSGSEAIAVSGTPQAELRGEVERQRRILGATG
jgi:hypothetical protein